MQQLTKHFSLAEFCFSQTATRLGKVIIVVPNSTIEINIRTLCEQVLEPLRQGIRKPIRITSGYRPIWLNKAIGGSNKSQHTQGQAADIIVPSMTPVAVTQLIVALGIEFDQCIIEYGAWVHISYVSPDSNRNQFLTATKTTNGTQYKIISKQELGELT